MIIEVKVIRTTRDGRNYTGGRVTVGYGGMLGWSTAWESPMPIKSMEPDEWR